MYSTKPGVYKIINIKTGNIYIGSSKNLSVRISSHKSLLRKNYPDNIRIRADLNLYGIDSFKFEVLEYCEDSIKKEREQFYYDLLKPYYNVWKSVYSAKGRDYLKEQITWTGRRNHIKDIPTFSGKLKEAWKKRKLRPDGLAAIQMLNRSGKPHSQKTKELLSKIHAGKVFSDEHRRKISETRSGSKFDPINRKWIKNETSIL